MTAFAWIPIALLLLVPSRVDGDASLEAFLKRVRTERAAEEARLRPQVEELVRKLGLARSTTDHEKLQNQLLALGTEAAPLLVPYLDPGPEAKPEAGRQAEEVAKVLERAPSPALLDDLVRLAHEASPQGRVFAVRLIGCSPETERAHAALGALHAEVNGELRAECVRALARLSIGDPLVLAALGDTHPAVISAGLRALAAEPRKAPRPEVLVLLADGSRGADVLPELVEYFSFPGQTLGEDAVVQLLRFACRMDLAPEARLKVLDGLPRFGISTPISSKLKKELEPLLTSADSALKDAALVALTLLGDTKAKRDLMRFYDSQVDNNKGWPLAYQRRGDVELRTGEYRAAARDYQHAIDLHEEAAKLPGNRDLWVNLARAHLKDGKPKPAAEALEEFGLTPELKRALKADPDFQPLVENPKYKDLFD